MKKVTEPSDKFLWLGNDPAIDFVNTAIVVDGRSVDLLQAPDDYLVWCAQAGVTLRITEKGRRELEAGYHLVKDFRGRLRGTFERLSGGTPIARRMLEATNTYLSGGARAANLEVHETTIEYRAFWQVREAADYVSPIANAFAEFLARADLQRIRKCKNPECVLFFYDVSKSGTRSWCSLDICGNKLRMAASRERHKTP